MAGAASGAGLGGEQRHWRSRPSSPGAFGRGPASSAATAFPGDGLRPDGAHSIGAASHAGPYFFEASVPLHVC